MDARQNGARLVAFGRFRFDMETARLFDADGALVPGPAKAFETLRVLLEHRDRIVSKDELLALVWPDAVVEEANLAQQIFTLRRLLGDEAARPALIATLPRRGYRFVGEVAAVAAPAAVPHGSADLARTSFRWTWALAVMAVLFAAILFTAVGWMTSAPSRREVAFELTMPAGLISRADLGLAGVSPDGASLAFIAQRANEAPAIWIREVAGGDARRLPGSENARLPFWSPDSRTLAFFQKSRLRALSLDGGAPRDICAVDGGMGGTWNAAGTIVFAARTRSALSMVPAAGGVPQYVTTLDANRRDVSHRFPSFLPDGRHFVFLVWAGDVEQQGIYLGSVDGSRPVRLLPDLSPARWAAGSLLFVRREALVAQSMTDTRLVGEPRIVATNVGRDPSDYVAFAASHSGDLVFQRGQQRTQLVWFDRTGRRLSDFGPPAHWADPAISPDGSRAAFIYRDREAGVENLDVWIDDLQRHIRNRVTLDPGIDVLPVWSPDGDSLVFRSNRTGFSDLYRKRLDRAGPETLLLASSTRKDPTDWSTDGKWILFTETPAAGPKAIWMIDSDGRLAARPLVKESADAVNGRLSPDAHYMAFESMQTGSREVYVQALEPGGRRWRITTDGGSEPVWRRDGRELFFVAHDSSVQAADVTRGAGGLEFGTPHELFKAPVFSWLRNGMSVSPDGQRFLISVAVEESRPTEVVLNWAGRPLHFGP